MKLDLGQLGASVFPLLRMIGMIVAGVGVSAIFGWYWYVYRRRKRWLVNIWERKADGRLHLIDHDLLTAKKFNKGKSTLYLLRHGRAECMPPPWEATYRLRGKEYCDYLRVEDDFLPIKRDLKQEFTDETEKTKYFEAIKALIKGINSLSTKEVEERYIYLPINHTLATEIEYEAIDYDVNMMRINAIDNLDQIFKDKEAFFEKYGMLISFTVIAGLLVVSLYLSYDFAQNVIGQAFGAADKVAAPLANLVEKIGGTAPPS